uniref:Uncharacterized protein n=1 Tax=Sipha flava TaxID=143950 RepID=A0A2S2QE01_9HEMI
MKVLNDVEENEVLNLLREFYDYYVTNNEIIATGYDTDQETLSAVLFHERVDSDDSFLNFSFPESPFRNADENSQTDFPSTPLFGHIDDDGENHSMLSRDHELMKDQILSIENS